MSQSARRRADEQAGPASGGSRIEVDDRDGEKKKGKAQDETQDTHGAMSRRLQDATEEALLTGGTAGRRAVDEAGFSADLKERLLDRIAAAGVGAAEQQQQQQQAAGGGGGGTQAWTGEESTQGAVRRMLEDAHRPLRGELRARRGGAAQRVAAARDKAFAYSGGGGGSGGDGSRGSVGLSGAERAQLKEEFRSRFEAGARPVPATLSGLTALANERIEAAMARGQFRDLRDRGRPQEEDALARNPFVDRTEFLLNRMIRRQEIVPPWIEKQQELGKAAGAFRSRLRAEWKRHAARMVAAGGGALEEQMRRAEGHAAAEEEEEGVGDDVGREGEGGKKADGVAERTKFRDPAWEKAEHAYLRLSVENLNALTRSYNLMAPELAKRPYFSLERELASCYRDVAPLVAGEIKSRALGPRARDAGPARRVGRDGEDGEDGGRQGAARIYVREGKGYGFREWWRDVRDSWRR
ncbi:hypothetical protein ESCO_002123 [Escovopsis weberi]|uniref:DnaJ homologue subfamily C member 28 conserved domain-containing protein n=1 Tax=Escovopsis weberi TaxID=150374 RepID=A0A0N0RU34_ESCWE|nr:hypothetical protein ESCO_002123 [Escovopsis weberi]